MNFYVILQTEFDVNCFLFSFYAGNGHYVDAFHCGRRKFGEIELDPCVYVRPILRSCLRTSWEKSN